MPKPLQTYEGPGIAVTFDPNICQHTGICVRGLPACGKNLPCRVHAHAHEMAAVAGIGQWFGKNSGMSRQRKVIGSLPSK